LLWRRSKEPLDDTFEVLCRGREREGERERERGKGRQAGRQYRQSTVVILLAAKARCSTASIPAQQRVPRLRGGTKVVWSCCSTNESAVAKAFEEPSHAAAAAAVSREHLADSFGLRGVPFHFLRIKNLPKRERNR
jgi:hypothetical protein